MDWFKKSILPSSGLESLLMNLSPVAKYRLLSIRARLAVALVCVERFCRISGLEHPELAAFFVHLWELPVMDNFPVWDSRKDPLTEAGLGDPFSPAIISMISVAGVAEPTFRKLIESTVEIVYSSAYAATDDEGSLSQLEEVLRITSGAGVSAPSAQPFSSSTFAEREGWGTPLPRHTVEQWRHANVL
ncbi:MAG: hypothetical protein QM796_16500 [Chthoniobacteraceae bacterium]